MAKLNIAYQVITDRILAALQQGVVPWQRPWKTSGMPRNFVSKRAYRGINLFLLSMTQYNCPFWVTYNQAKALGGNIKKGEKAMPVVFWKLLHNTRENEEGETEDRMIPFLRYYNVFNLEQTEGIEIPKAPEVAPFQPIEAAQALAAGMPNAPQVNHGGDRACYIPSQDRVQMPIPESFDLPEHYYSTLFHELTHSTAHASRLDRNKMKLSYAEEELVAEMGASFLGGLVGIDLAVKDNSAAYIASWLKALQNDPKMVVLAAARAQKAADYIANVKAKTETQEQEAA